MSKEKQEYNKRLISIIQNNTSPNDSDSVIEYFNNLVFKLKTENQILKKGIKHGKTNSNANRRVSKRHNKSL
jgi:hypothetical protein